MTLPSVSNYSSISKYEAGGSTHFQVHRKIWNCLIDWLFTDLRPAQEFFTYMETSPMLGAQGLWAGRDLYRATPAATRDLGFSGLIRRTAWRLIYIKTILFNEILSWNTDACCTERTFIISICKTASCYEELRNCISGHVHRALCTVPQLQYTRVFTVLRKPFYI